MCRLSTVLTWLSVMAMALSSTMPTETHRYCIVGAGPAGLQLGYFFEKHANLDYVILDRNSEPGSFFEHYPIHRKLISINKRYTGHDDPEYNLRHDWNSLISDNRMRRFTNYTRDFWPHADVYLQYLKDYAQTYDLNIDYNTNVQRVEDIHHLNSCSEEAGCQGSNFKLHTPEKTYMCNVLVMATGMYKPYIPRGVDATNFTMCGDAATEPEAFEGKNVLVLGKGNSGMEVATVASEAANYVHMMSRNRVRLSWQTHYVGDIRAVNGLLLDMYQLKSLDGFVESDISKIKLVKREDGRFYQEAKDERQAEELERNGGIRHPYDEVISCLGYKFDMDPLSDLNVSYHLPQVDKYPLIDDGYRLVGVSDAYVAGTASHSLDHRKSSGGFIHGFRYTARTLFNMLMENHENEAWPSEILDVCQVLNKTLDRANRASSIYQMFGVLSDVMVMRLGEGDQVASIQYYEDIPYSQVEKRFPNDFTVTMSMQYHPEFSCPGCDTVRKGRAVGTYKKAHESNFLHPVFKLRRPGFYYAKKLREFHLVEDFYVEFDSMENHLAPLARHFKKLIPETVECDGWKEALEYTDRESS
eukprot:TRINITY_DN10652_c0_g1_i5.p1 TRINITY_DN10652_c0_g1~~TRINITY_DN10652_c0_g1_i5.p1  ORF type:complete len:585 (+),score=160.19 TRINITY_DN10652_c0_g1_i5:143-1897(+)